MKPERLIRVIDEVTTAYCVLLKDILESTVRIMPAFVVKVRVSVTYDPDGTAIMVQYITDDHHRWRYLYEMSVAQVEALTVYDSVIMQAVGPLADLGGAETTTTFDRKHM